MRPAYLPSIVFITVLALGFTATAAAQTPTIQSITPAPLHASNSEQPIVINGSDFNQQATVTWRDPDGALYERPHDHSRIVTIEANRIEARINFAGHGGKWAVRITNPNGRSSDWFAFHVDGLELQPHVAEAKAFIEDRWDVLEVATGLERTDFDTSEHPHGRALDIFVTAHRTKAEGDSKSLGDEIAAWFVDNANRFGTEYVIWYERINTLNGWRPYTRYRDQPNDHTLQHRDHIHITFVDLPDGDDGRTGGHRQETHDTFDPQPSDLFRQGEYTEPEGGRFFLGGADAGGGRSVWSLSQIDNASSRAQYKRFSATWATGSIDNHPHLKNYPATETLPGSTFAYGHASTRETGPRNGRLIGVRQTGDLISITFFAFESDSRDSDAGVWMPEEVFVIRTAARVP